MAESSGATIFSPEVWAIILAFVIPLGGALVGVLFYSVRVLETRVYTLAIAAVTQQGLAEALRPTMDRVARLENQIDRRVRSTDRLGDG